MASSSSDPGKSEVGGGGGAAEGSEAAAVAVAVSVAVGTDQALLYRGLKKAKKERGCTAKERISKMPPCAAGKRSSIYRGVTRYTTLLRHSISVNSYYAITYSLMCFSI